MRYKILLFDLDDTLLDFGANEADSLSSLFQQHGYAFTDEIFNTYEDINKKLWSDYEKGKGRPLHYVHGLGEGEV